MRRSISSCIWVTAGIAIVLSGTARALSAPVPQRPTRASVTSLRCPSSTLCVAIGVGGPNLVTSRSPRSGTAGWTAEAIDGGEQLKLLACASAKWCLAVDQRDRVLTSVDPARGAPSWRLAPGGRAGHLDNVAALSCPTPHLCVGVAGHYVVTSTHPNRGGSAWRQALVNQDARADDINCPSATLCVAAGTDGQVAISHDPIARTPWRHTALGSPQGGPGQASVSCASVTRCMLSEPGGYVFSTTNLDGAAVTWRRARLGPSRRSSRPPLSRFPSSPLMLSCTSDDVCAAAGAGSVWASPAPGPSGLRRWTRVIANRRIVLTDPLLSIACVRGPLCVASDGDGHAVSATAVTRPGAWREQTIGGPLSSRA